jgi:hypothetical protein
MVVVAAIVKLGAQKVASVAMAVGSVSPAAGPPPLPVTVVPPSPGAPPVFAGAPPVPGAPPVLAGDPPAPGDEPPLLEPPGISVPPPHATSKNEAAIQVDIVFMGEPPRRMSAAYQRQPRTEMPANAAKDAPSSDQRASRCRHA